MFLYLCSVHLKIHIPKIIKKHTHVQTIYKHHFQKVPVLEEGEEDEYRDGSEKYLRIDPKTASSSSYSGGNEVRSLKWVPHFNYQKTRDLPLTGLKRYPKNVRVVHEYEEYPRKPKSHRIVKQLIPTYAIQEESDEDYSPASHEDYAETKPKKSYIKHSLKFIPASDVAQYIPAIPFSALTAQSQFKPLWTPSDYMSRPAKHKEHRRPSRSSRYEDNAMLFSADGAHTYSTPILPSTQLERKFRRNH